MVKTAKCCSKQKCQKSENSKCREVEERTDNSSLGFWKV